MKRKKHKTKQTLTRLTGFFILLIFCHCAPGGSMGELNGLPSNNVTGIEEIPIEADGAPVATIPLPSNDGDTSWQNQLIISTPDANGLPVIQIPESVEPEHTSGLADHILIVEQDAQTSQKTDNPWQRFSRQIDHIMGALSAKLIQSARAFAPEIGLDYQDAYCELPNIQCFTLSSQGTLNPQLIEITNVNTDPENYITPSFSIQLLDPKTNTIKGRTKEKSLDFLTFTANVPFNNTSRIFDSSEKQMFLTTHKGEVSQLKLSGNRFMTQSGDFENKYLKTMISDDQDFGDVESFTYDPVHKTFVFMDKLQIVAAPLNTLNNQLDTPFGTTKGECSMRTMCKPAGMKTKGKGDKTNIYYATKTWLQSSKSGSIRKLYNPDVKDNKPVFFSNVLRDFTEEGAPLRHLKTLAFTSDPKKQIAAIFQGTGDPIPGQDELSDSETDNESSEDHDLDEEEIEEETVLPARSPGSPLVPIGLSMTASSLTPIQIPSIDSYNTQYYLTVSRNLNREQVILRNDWEDKVELYYSNIIIQLDKLIDDASRVKEINFLKIQKENDSDDGIIVILTDTTLYFATYDNIDQRDGKHIEILDEYSLKYQGIKGYDLHKETGKIFILAQQGSSKEPDLIEIGTNKLLTNGPKIIRDVNLSQMILNRKKFALRPFDLKVYHSKETNNGYVTFFSNSLKSMVAIPIQTVLDSPDKSSFHKN